ncbi:acyltransferase Pun1 [Ricinus communis]|uniref:3'-N-debenzoyl-2'-deoxytaxol N-benzoyltransferase, putative n=1 Tax=Ricinus communis TaxID=3988 RepID=B9RML6_RICCO|nr:acyltransferase Pun1 [Ricinus communis]EEF47539.1 3'-N-debenzoyl-2'-deoxytaxol N-benzoyltransferase, putative [Ricinus communis]|eukprot:XP_025012419.1 acylsugar acyltransferase 3-like [Ricinus communis]
MKSEIVSSEIIKPSSASPNRPRIHHLSFFDQISSCIYIPVIFFYPKQQLSHNPIDDDIVHKSTLLKESLSLTLSHYYPLAGRIKDDLTIDCNDKGVEFLEARMRSNLSEILKHPDDSTLKSLFPGDLQYKDPILSSLLIVQSTFFDCGGMAVAVCISHKISDIASMCYFINHWAAIACSQGEKLCPEFNLGSLYPPIDLPVTETYQGEKVKCVSRRLVFDALKIAKLKEMVAKEVSNPTRVEVVSAILYRSAISAARLRSGSSKPTAMHNAANLRPRVLPPLPECSAGNISGTFSVTTMEDSVIELVQLASEVKKEKTEYCNSCGQKFSAEELCAFVLDASVGLRLCHGKDQDVYLCSSFCRYPFYDADFGWGKPGWVTVASCEVKNVIILMDTKCGDGIEAYVTLEEQEMDLFENDEELLCFACINPCVLPESNSH